MRTALAAGVLVCLWLGSALAADAWLPYASAEGGFRAMFPGTPEVTVKPVDADGGVAHYVSAKAPHAHYWVIYTVYPSGTLDATGDEHYLDNVRDGIVAATHWQIDAERKTDIAGYPARELEFGIPQQPDFARIVVFRIRNRGYQVAAIGGAGFGKGADAARFVDSFHVTAH